MSGQAIQFLSDPIPSELWNNGTALAVDTTSADIVADGFDAVHVGSANTLDITVIHSASADASVVVVTEYSAKAATVANQISQTEVSVSATDLLVTVNLSMVGGSPATAYAKTRFRVAVTPGAWFKLSLNNIDGGAAYALYQLLGLA